MRLRILKGPDRFNRERPLCNATELTREGRTLCPGIYRSSVLHSKQSPMLLKSRPHYKTCTVMCSRYAAFQACQCAGIANVKPKIKGLMLMRTFFRGNIYVACISRNFGVVAKESTVFEHKATNPERCPLPHEICCSK